MALKPSNSNNLEQPALKGSNVTCWELAVSTPRGQQILDTTNSINLLRDSSRIWSYSECGNFTQYNEFDSCQLHVKVKKSQPMTARSLEIETMVSASGTVIFLR